MVMKNKRVAIDASPALTFGNNYLSGVGRSTVELIHAIEAIENKDIDIGLFVQRLSRERLQKYHFKSSSRALPLPRWPSLDWVRSALPTVELMTGADVIHVQNLAPVFNPNRVIVTLHDAIFLVHPEPHLHTPEETKKMVDLARSCRAIITDSEHSKKDISNCMQIDPQKISVCYLGYDDKNFYVEPDQDRVKQILLDKFSIDTPYFVSVSCSIGRKNSPAVVEQFIRLCNEGCDHHLVMVWRNPPDEVLKKVEAASLSKQIHFLKGVSDDDLRLLYNGATATLFPSSYEGFGFPVVESMACGTPVVTTNASSLPEVGGAAAIYIQAGDHDALLTVMRDIVNNRINLSEISARGLDQVKKFSWEKCALETIHVYEQTLEGLS